MLKVGADNEKIKYILNGKYEKDGYILIDDLSILEYENCKKSDIQFVVVCEELIESNEAKELVKFYSRFNTLSVSEKVFNRLASKENCAGILIVTKLKEDKSFLDKKNAFILVCDGLEISGNMGTIIRTSEAVLVDGIIFTNLKAKVGDKVVRSSRGTIFNVPFCIIDDLEELKKILRDKNYRTVVCEPEQGVDFKDFNYNGNVAFIVGSERYGVSKLWFDDISEYLKIKMFGKMDSLNVGVATSIILYEAKYKRN